MFIGLTSNGRGFATAFGKAPAVMSPDRRTIEFHISLPFTGAVRTSVSLRSGDTALVEITVPDEDTGYLLVTSETRVPKTESQATTSTGASQ